MKAFISYAHPDGLGLARNCADAMVKEGTDSWCWDQDKLPRLGTWTQIAGELVSS